MRATVSLGLNHFSLVLRSQPFPQGCVLLVHTRLCLQMQTGSQTIKICGESVSVCGCLAGQTHSVFSRQSRISLQIFLFQSLLHQSSVQIKHLTKSQFHLDDCEYVSARVSRAQLENTVKIMQYNGKYSAAAREGSFGVRTLSEHAVFPGSV